MRKPSQPNVLGYYQYQSAKKKNAPGAPVAKPNTASVRKEVQTVSEATNNTDGKNSPNKPKLSGFIYHNKHMTLGICLMFERTIRYV